MTGWENGFIVQLQTLIGKIFRYLTLMILAFDQMIVDFIITSFCMFINNISKHFIFEWKTFHYQSKNLPNLSIISQLEAKISFNYEFLAHSVSWKSNLLFIIKLISGRPFLWFPCRRHSMERQVKNGMKAQWECQWPQWEKYCTCPKKHRVGQIRRKDSTCLQNSERSSSWNP